MLSETLKPLPSDKVMRWPASQDPLSLFITVITQAEILLGIEAMPAGRRKQWLSEVVEGILTEDFRGRILPFDQDAARQYATILAARKAAGRPMSQFDAMIAGIARSHGAPVATRNTADFKNCGIRLINPWLP
jgi:predicted nucleic acid-binding protein